MTRRVPARVVVADRDGLDVEHGTAELARTQEGGTVLWLGRDKRAGRGEGSSGMRFDAADPVV